MEHSVSMTLQEKGNVHKNPEPLKSAEAFEYYYAQGDERSLNQVAKALKIGKTQLYNWSRKFFYTERVLARDFVYIKEMRLQSSRNITEMKTKFAEALRNKITATWTTDKKGNTKFNTPISNMSDLNQAIKLWLLLSGEATDVHAVRIEIVETVINYVIQVINQHIPDPKLLATLAVELKKGMDFTTSPKLLEDNQY